MATAGLAKTLPVAALAQRTPKAEVPWRVKLQAMFSLYWALVREKDPLLVKVVPHQEGRAAEDQRRDASSTGSANRIAMMSNRPKCCTFPPLFSGADTFLSPK